MKKAHFFAQNVNKLLKLRKNRKNSTAGGGKSVFGAFFGRFGIIYHEFSEVAKTGDFEVGSRRFGAMFGVIQRGIWERSSPLKSGAFEGVFMVLFGTVYELISG